MLRLKPRVCFRVQRNGISIRKHFLKGGVNAGITYNQSFAEAEACIAAGLDYHAWRNDFYEQDFKSEVVAWHQMKGLIEAHIKSAEAKHMEKRTGKKGKK